MANWHMLEGGEDGNTYKVVFHIPIPGGANNRAGVAYRTAIIASGIGGGTILKDGDGTVGTITGVEKDQIASGALIEVVNPYSIAGGPSKPLNQLQQELDAIYNELADPQGEFVNNNIKNRLMYYGGSH